MERISEKIGERLPYIGLVFIFSILFLAVLVSQAEAAIPPLNGVDQAPVVRTGLPSGDQVSPAFAQSRDALENLACDVADQDGVKDYRFCQASGGKYRCYADVRYPNGSQIRVWGNGCYERFADCWWNGVGAVNPCR